MSIDEKPDGGNTPKQVKRPKLDSTSSDPGLAADAEVESQIKRVKLEQVNESSPGNSEANPTTE